MPRTGPPRTELENQSLATRVWQVCRMPCMFVQLLDTTGNRGPILAPGPLNVVGMQHLVTRSARTFTGCSAECSPFPCLRKEQEDVIPHEKRRPEQRQGRRRKTR